MNNPCADGNAGFFQKLIAFFQWLFNALPKETVKP